MTDGELLEKLGSLKPEDLDRDLAEFFTDVAWNKDEFVADGATLPLAVAIKAIEKATAPRAPGHDRTVIIGDL